jgi:hypothetical protein
LRRFFIAIASLLLSFLTRRERLSDGLPSLIRDIPEGFLSSLSPFLEPGELTWVLGVELSPPPPPPELLAELSDEELEFDSVLGLAVELLVEDDEELPTLLIVTLLTLRVPVLAAIRIRRVFSSAADITLLEHYI